LISVITCKQDSNKQDPNPHLEARVLFPAHWQHTSAMDTYCMLPESFKGGQQTTLQNMAGIDRSYIR